MMVFSRIGWRNSQTMGVVLVCVVASGSTVFAADEKAAPSGGVVDQIGRSVKNLATKIENEVAGAVKKLEGSETPKKVGNEVKRSANVLGEKVEEAGKKLKESFKPD